MRWTRKGNAMPPCKFVKWFTKCLLYSLLLKICTGLSLLFSCLFFLWDVLQMFPADCICHHMHQTGEALEAACALRQKTGARTTKSDSLFSFLPTLSDEHISEFTPHLKDEHKCTFTTGKAFNRRHIYPDLFLRVRRLLRRLSVVPRCSPTTCKVASIPT